MRYPVLAAAVGLSVMIAGPSIGAPPAGSPDPANPQRPASQTICLDVGGETRAPICRGSSSRLDQRYDICTCENAQTVEAPLCGEGERPQAETRAFELARKEAARDGNLFGDQYNGRSMCVQPRNR